jgi:glycosyltransferase involved in cell wall biosynthesis
MELLVIDDGELAPDFQQKLAALLPEWIEWRYHRKQQPGLYGSLREAVRIVRYPVILFLDDDVEVEPGYLVKLQEHYRQNPDLAGVGGVDRLQRSSWLWRWYMRLFLYSSGEAGKLSFTGFAGSLPLWNQADRMFFAEYLYGCNMSFRRNALLALPDCDWLAGYSLGIDLLLPWIAARQGPVMVDPAMGIRHYQSPASRDKLERMATMQIVNHAHMLVLFGGTCWQKRCFYWTWLGLYLLTMPQGVAGKRRRAGYVAGLKLALVILED